ILDGHRQWFKAAVGLSVRETPREISFCTHAVESSEPMVVADASKDPRFSSNSLVINEPHLAFYAGVPLRNSDDLAIGTFCIMDHAPRVLSDHEMTILRVIANQVMKLLELRYERQSLKTLAADCEQLNENLKDSEQRWKFALEGAGDGVWDWNLKTNVVFFSRRWKEMLGYVEGELPSHYKNWLEIVHKDDTSSVMESLNKHLENRSESFSAEFRAQCKDGRWLWVLSRGIVVEWDASGSPSRIVGTQTDISARKETEELIWKQANFDGLTSLPNRRMFFNRLSEEIKRAARNKKAFAVMFIDLDGFKPVNDKWGHQAGDDLLVQVSQRLTTCIRQTDTSARFGGDEFTVILTGLSDAADVEVIASKVLDSLNQPFDLGGRIAQISASIGIATYPAHGVDGDSLISHADSAMYDAKGIGKNCWVMFDPKSIAYA
ncbi:MAG: diguanylate cyclase, partial [Nitrosomonadales bacterium]|nr:diguanylate cyclase [Nitrosomonadales bacterium]